MELWSPFLTLCKRKLLYRKRHHLTAKQGFWGIDLSFVQYENEMTPKLRLLNYVIEGDLDFRPAECEHFEKKLMGAAGNVTFLICGSFKIIWKLNNSS